MEKFIVVNVGLQKVLGAKDCLCKTWLVSKLVCVEVGLYKILEIEQKRAKLVDAKGGRKPWRWKHAASQGREQASKTWRKVDKCRIQGASRKKKKKKKNL